MFDAIIEKVERLVDLLEERSRLRTRYEVAARFLQASILNGKDPDEQMAASIDLAERLQDDIYGS